jgi:hypothetical protein
MLGNRDTKFDFAAHHLAAFANRALQFLVQLAVIGNVARKLGRFPAGVKAKHVSRNQSQRCDPAFAAPQRSQHFPGIQSQRTDNTNSGDNNTPVRLVFHEGSLTDQAFIVNRLSG